jgi:hypothetical protein
MSAHLPLARWICDGALCLALASLAAGCAGPNGPPDARAPSTAAAGLGAAALVIEVTDTQARVGGGLTPAADVYLWLQNRQGGARVVLRSGPQGHDPATGARRYVMAFRAPAGHYRIEQVASARSGSPARTLFSTPLQLDFELAEGRADYLGHLSISGRRGSTLVPAAPTDSAWPLETLAIELIDRLDADRDLLAQPQAAAAAGPALAWTAQVPAAAAHVPRAHERDAAPTAGVPKLQLPEPGMTPASQAALKRYSSMPSPKAFALSSGGRHASAEGPDAVRLALGRCEGHGQGKCRLYALNDQRVWGLGLTAERP